MRWLIAPILALILFNNTGNARSLPEPEIWFNPHTPADILNMWTDTAPWQTAAGKVKVLVLVDWWVRQVATKPQLAQILDFAARHHMKIDLDTEPVARFSTDTCGSGEGYSAPGDLAAAVQILSSLGAKLDWVDMDEPVWWGSYSTDPTKCHLPIADVVTRTALIMKELLSVYPNVGIMEIEPFPALNSVPTWREDETAFHVGLAQQLGKRVQIMQMDVQWNGPGWQQSVLDLHAYLRQENMGFGIIYDGSDQTTSNTDWINSAISNWEMVEGQMHIVPEEILFTSWNAYPTNNMPDTSPAAQTWLINRYPRPRAELEVQFVGQGAHGKLTTADGKPIANATVNGFIPGVDYSKPLPVQVVQGVVPATAVTGLIAVRLNAECNCEGLNNVLFGSIAYQETQGGSATYVYSFQTAPGIMNGAILGGEKVGGTMVSHIISFPGQALELNGQFFPVTANAQYQFTIPAATVGGAGWYGSVIMIFVDKNGNGTRVTVVPSPGKALMSTAVTQPDGSFTLFPLPRSVDGPSPVTVEFDGGGGAYRSTVWTPLR